MRVGRILAGTAVQLAADPTERLHRVTNTDMLNR
jgi:hypothetical protein